MSGNRGVPNVVTAHLQSFEILHERGLGNTRLTAGGKQQQHWPSGLLVTSAKRR